jgi:glucose-1-phosphate thymidylyltransferase
MPVGRPFIDHVLHAVGQAGLTDVCLVVGPDADALRGHYASGRAGPLRVHVAVQAQPRGTADALAAARAFIGDAPVLTLNGDNLYPAEDIAALAALGGPGLVGFSGRGLVTRGNVPAERLGAFALLQVGVDGCLDGIIEKPDPAQLGASALDAQFSMNLWALPPAIVAACDRVAPSARGELELPDAVRLTMREQGTRYRVLTSDEGVLDLSRRGDVADVTARLAGQPIPW